MYKDDVFKKPVKFDSNYRFDLIAPLGNGMYYNKTLPRKIPAKYNAICECGGTKLTIDIKNKKTVCQECKAEKQYASMKEILS